MLSLGLLDYCRLKTSKTATDCDDREGWAEAQPALLTTHGQPWQGQVNSPAVRVSTYVLAMA